jgi:hypothetical protein
LPLYEVSAIDGDQKTCEQRAGRVHPVEKCDGLDASIEPVVAHHHLQRVPRAETQRETIVAP